jgi:hypothetical protein
VFKDASIRICGKQRTASRHFGQKSKLIQHILLENQSKTAFKTHTNLNFIG